MFSPALTSLSSENQQPGYFNANAAALKNNPQQEAGSKQISQRPTSSPNTASAQLVAESYSSDSLFISYTNNDGDTVSLSMEHVEYQKAMLQVEGDPDSEEWKQIVQSIKDEFLAMKQDMVDRFIASLNGEKPEKKEVEETDEKSSLEGLPEYWNAENTSQRIVDFALSFAGLFEGSSEEFATMIRGAIDEGFKQARDLMGDLPDEVSGLVNDTYDLVMQKLDAWVESQAAGSAQPEEVAAQPAA